MLDHPLTRLVAQTPTALPVEALVRGKPVEEVAELIPRLFNLCRAAQRVAVRAALGLPVTPQDLEAAAQEIRREHELRLAVLLPLAFGLPAGRAPTAFPATPEEYELFMLSDAPLAALLRRIGRAFGPGLAVAVRPFPNANTVMNMGALDNSVAARVADDPVMRHVEARCGRGPLWRVVARAVELRRCDQGWQPWPVRHGASVVVPAARGAYAVTAVVCESRVETFHRITPTDHLLASGGVLQASLETLHDHTLADALLAVLDPCSPVTLREVPADA